MYFAKYLVEKELVALDEVLASLGEQLDKSKSLSEIILGCGIIPKEKILDIFDYSVNSGLGLIKSLEHFFDEETVDKIKAKQEKATVSFLSILIERGILTEKNAENIVKNFEDENKTSTLVGPSTKSAEGHEEEIENDTGGKINIAALESLKELGMISPAELEELEGATKKNIKKTNEKEESSNIFLEEYVRVFSESMRSEFQMLSNKILENNNTDQYGVILGKIYNILHTLYGSSKLGKARISQKLIGQWEDVFKKLHGLSDHNFVKPFNFKVELLIDSFDLLWELRKSIDESGGEKTFWKNEQNKQNYINNFKKIKI